MRWNAFDTPVHDSQRVYRQLLSAMAEPGTFAEVGGAPLPPPGAAIGTACWATLLTLCDLDTRVWLAPELDAVGLGEALAFHTGARQAERPDVADFALVTPATLAAKGEAEAPAFQEGSDTFPDRSTTLVVMLDRLDTAGPWALSGPGIPVQRRLGVGQGGEALMTRLAANRDRFPRGLDAILTCGTRLAAVPRSTRITRSASEEVDTCMSP
ncbi:phosphonate C-P lyase system protein PhnH [Halomonas ventosae]|uniref:Alpha-D-ribose 1-methylphosphonate 5-triphosphate synthase subunit PhnH n=1 Tax=Halomonas ventosae TaxID=229007 RepID=A0A2T0VQT2_9GAMM|nr:phosphonate C-P lyase system protein PhnH [Halomonas ventosae]PRY72731.1 alpha-D-ribose 1-methylphosphonate 5-triphosphate synthase subunit PhnH [Halomonas ventosae]